VKAILRDLLTAFQFCTRIRMPSMQSHAESLSDSLRFFPFVGLALGLIAGLMHFLLLRILDPELTAALVLLSLVMLTGALHEDGLGDAADGLGGGWNREQVLTIMRDSRVGSYGVIALVFSLLLRWLLLSKISPAHFLSIVVTAQVLCRWSTLPLSYFLPPARAADGQGARVAQLTTRNSLLTGSLIALVIVGVAMRSGAWKPIVFACIVTLLSGLYYKKRIGGVTGDCFGATNQLVEIAVYFVGVIAL
jgi:adenosylcobinamide-GDP ribazoletransferase